MKALAISLFAGAALAGAVSAPASAIPASNLTSAASDVAVAQTVRYVRHYQRSRARSSAPITAMEPAAAASHRTRQARPATRKVWSPLRHCLGWAR